MTQRSQNVSISCSKEAVNGCVRYILCREGSKIPIKRSDIINHISETGKVTKQNAINVFNAAQKELKKVYGYKIVELKLKDALQCIIVLDKPEKSLLSSSTNPYHRRLLIAALTHIFMSSGPVPEDDMWKFLAEAYVLEENDYNQRKIVTNVFTKQLYLNHYKEGEGELAKLVFDWGPRAHIELPKMFLLNKVASALEKDPQHWSEQYKIAASDNSNQETI
ncbi:Melanoma antigen protein 2 [Danaus plexippus plexippus]|uniref:Melanoma antigen protein 2 n=1 Tax=Danaus plexippus plexippus TaxID=278856 RepID=A0A212FJR2_DANPL|nr:Melanoma antigen protein 2 [Danaus plexippus plexippus]